MTVERFPRWLRPPPGGFVAEDLDRLPDLPPHTELIDGSLVFGSPQAKFHMLVISLLDSVLRRLAPEHLRVRREMTVTLGRDQRPEPDLIVIHADRDGGPELTSYQADDASWQSRWYPPNLVRAIGSVNRSCTPVRASLTSGGSRT
ncbi:Uma2 family endonuclease [Nocardia gipuzkoensis]|uniref:Uma2 family endonuclease n=1 Tax=Nocardia gipuzkoensis TaxID=2749991 RepID=UPI001C66F6F5|nr:Uma2 family endonuclease [Nocardia gipuzkoensis]